MNRDEFAKALEDLAATPEGEEKVEIVNKLVNFEFLLMRYEGRRFISVESMLQFLSLLEKLGAPESAQLKYFTSQLKTFWIS